MCDEESLNCQHLAFEEPLDLANHYMRMHGKQMPIKASFAYSDDEEEYKGHGRYHEEDPEVEDSKEESKQFKPTKQEFPTLSKAYKDDSNTQS